MADLEIKLKIDRTQAKQETAGHVADVQKAEDTITATIRKAIGDQEAMVIAKDRKVAASNEARVQVATKALADEERAQLSATDKAKEHGLAIGKAALAYATLENGIWVVAKAVEMWKNLRQSIEDATLRAISYQDKMLELAALKDKLGNPVPVVAEQLQFRAKTLQTADAANTFQQGLLNSGQAAMLGGFISRDQLLGDPSKKISGLAGLAGSYQAATNADPNALGSLAGSLSTAIGTQNQNSEDVFRRLVGVFNIIQQGGAKTLGQGVGQFQGNLGLVGKGLYNSPEELAAIQSAFSVDTPDEAGTRTKQFLQATKGGLTRSATTGKENTVSQADYLKSIGATPQNNAAEIGKMIVADMQKQRTTDPKFDSLTYLGSKGYEDQDTRNVLMAFDKIVNSGLYDKSFGPLANPNAAPGLAAAMAPVNAFRSTDVAMQRSAKVSGDIADAAIGTGPEAFYLSMKERAFNSLRAASPKVYGKSFEDYNKDPIYEGKLHDEMKRLMDVEAAKVGVASPEGKGGNWDRYLNYGTTAGLMGPVGQMIGAGSEYGPLGGHYASHLIYNDKERAESYYGYASEIRQAGGDPLNQDELLKRNTDAMEKNSAIVEANTAALKGGNPGQPVRLPAPVVNVNQRPPIQTR